jgi:cytoskeletal protein CcmA (bactofilin family)
MGQIIASKKVRLQATSPGTAETGHLNISGIATANQVQAASGVFVTNGSSSFNFNAVTSQGLQIGAGASKGDITSYGDLTIVGATQLIGTAQVGTMLATTMTATGTVQGATLTSTGAVNGASEAITGASTAASYTATGTVQGATVNATGKGQLNGVTVLENATSFPGSPLTNQRCFRTDLGLEYFYDGTRWLSVQIFSVALTLLPSTRTGNSLSATTTNVLIGPHPDNSSDVYITTIVGVGAVQTTNNSTNYWQMTARTRTTTTTNGSTNTSDTKLWTAGNLGPFTATVNAVVTRANYFDVLVDFTKVSSPGNLLFETATLNCRLIAV